MWLINCCTGVGWHVSSTWLMLWRKLLAVHALLVLIVGMELFRTSTGHLSSQTVPLAGLRMLDVELEPD